MLTAARNAAWAAAFFFIVAFSVSMMMQASQHSSKQQGQNAESTNLQDKFNTTSNQPDPDGWHKYKDRMDRYWQGLLGFVKSNNDVIVAICTALVAAFTIVLAFATVFLWYATRDLVKGSEETAERQLRAYVAIQSGRIDHAVVDNAPGFRVQIQLKNSGLTPAYGFTTWVMEPKILPVDAIPFGPPRPLSERTGSSIMGPGADTWINWYARFSGSDLDDIRTGKKAIFVWGGADYTDAFGKRRYFIFRDMMTGTEENPAVWALKPHRLGYDAN